MFIGTGSQYREAIRRCANTMTHFTTFHTSACGKMHRAVCSCGWRCDSSSLLQCQLEASCHDIDEDAPALDHPHAALRRALADAGYMPMAEYVEGQS